MKNYTFLLALCLISINLCAVKTNNSDEAPMPQLQPSISVELPKPVFGPQKPLTAEQRKINRKLKELGKELYRKHKAEKEQNIHPQGALMPVQLFTPVQNQDNSALVPDEDLNTN